MRKFLAIFGTLTVTTSSVGFLSNAFFTNKTTINIKDETKDLTEAKITELDKESQSWNNEKIDETLKYSLKYHNNQLIINKKQLDMTKLPTEVLNHLDLALVYLNEAVNNGYIKVVVNNNKVELIYPSTITTFNSLDVNSDIIYFDSKPTLTNFHSSYMWYSTYGPSHWWKFWEWGGYIHFGETAVKNAKWVNFLASTVSISALFKNITKISSVVDNTINASEESMKKISVVLGDIDLSSLGTLSAALVIIKTVVSFIKTLTIAAPWILAIVVVISTIIDVITGRMINIDRGNGIKWQWPCFIIPGKILVE